MIDALEAGLPTGPDPMWDLDHVTDRQVHTRVFDALAGTASGMSLEVTGTGTAAYRTASQSDWPALRLAIGATTGTTAAWFGGECGVSPVVRALVLDAHGIYHGDSDQWTLGFYGSAGAYIELRRYPDRVGLAARRTTGATIHTSRPVVGGAGPWHGLHGLGARAGLMIDFSRGEILGHVGYSFARITATDGLPTVPVRPAFSVPPVLNAGASIKRGVLSVIR